MQSSSSERFSLAEYADFIDEVLENGGEFTLFPRGTSMLPLIREGRDSVTLVKAPPEKGDIAFYRRTDGSFILHRVISVDGGVYTMCGDNQLALERGITAEQIKARAAYITRGGRKITPKSFRYRVYLTLWRSFFVRRVYFRLRRMFNVKKQ